MVVGVLLDRVDCEILHCFPLCCVVSHTSIIAHGCDTLGQMAPSNLKETQKNPIDATAKSGAIINSIMIQLMITSLKDSRFRNMVFLSCD